MIQEWNPESFKDSKIPYTKYNFKKTVISFELNAFEFERSSESSYKRDEYLLSLGQIYNLNDSIKLKKRKQNEKINGLITDQISLLKDSGYKCSKIIEDYIQKVFEKQSKKGIKRDHQIAIKKLDQLRNHLKVAKARDKSAENFISNLKIEWNRKFTLSYAVFMLFFLRSTTGSSCKKRWIGMASTNCNIDFS